MIIALFFCPFIFISRKNTVYHRSRSRIHVRLHSTILRSQQAVDLLVSDSGNIQCPSAKPHGIRDPEATMAKRRKAMVTVRDRYSERSGLSPTSHPLGNEQNIVSGGKRHVPWQSTVFRE